MADTARETAPNPTKSFYDRISKAYDLIADSSEHTARERGLALLAAAAGEKVLVVGFGTGHSVASLARSVGPQGRVFGIDISEGMLAVASKRVVDEGLAARVELSLGDARSLKFGDGQFDTAFISFTLELFNETEIPRVLREIRRVLRPGGRLAVVAMAREPHENVMTDFYVWMHRHFPHFVDCQPIAARNCIERAGFTVERAERMAIWSLPVASVLARKPSAHA
jgi:demethylmenaquinone methyltransferase/2-methoxy-6-polyprenyl-1,4-benzoquinol methylase